MNITNKQWKDNRLIYSELIVSNKVIKLMKYQKPSNLKKSILS